MLVIMESKYTRKKIRWIPNMMVWKRWLLLDTAIFGIYVKFLGDTVDGQNPAPPIMIIIPLFIGL